ncbi:Hypothetical protein FKW44_013970, partial [Caligus rogercresseyi]
SDIVGMKNDLEILEFLNYRSKVMAGREDKIVHSIVREREDVLKNPVPDDEENDLDY